jgi:hypothetical protein
MTGPIVHLVQSFQNKEETELRDISEVHSLNKEGQDIRVLHMHE